MKNDSSWLPQIKNISFYFSITSLQTLQYLNLVNRSGIIFKQDL